MKLLEKLIPPLEALVVSFLITVPAFGAKIVVTDSYEIDSAEKIAEVLASDGIDIAANATVTYSDAAHELVLDKPVTGGGLFSVNGGKHLVLMGDSRDFTGSWEVGGTSTIAVSNRYGLGSSVTTKITILSGAKTKALTFGGDGLTNDVPITSLANVNFRNSKDDTFVQNGLYTHSKAQTVYGGGLVFRGGFNNTSGSITFGAPENADYDGQSVRFEEKPLKMGGGHITFGGSGSAVLDYYLAVAGNTSANVNISRCRVHCEAKDVLPKTNVGGLINYNLGGKYDTAQYRVSVLDLNGYDQSALSVHSNWTPLEDDSASKYISEVTSATPATLTISPTEVRTTATRFTGAVSLDYSGRGTYSIAKLLSTTTGKLIVSSGTVELKWGAGWSGDAEVRDGAVLGVASKRAFTGGAGTVTVATGGKLVFTAGSRMEVDSLVLDGTAVPAGAYTAEGLVASGFGEFVSGSGEIQIGAEPAALSGSHIRDNMVFDLVLPQETASVTSADIVDGLTWSAANRLGATALCTFDPSADPAATEKFGTPSPIRVEKVRIKENAFPYQAISNEYNALVFPENVRTHDNGDGTTSVGCYCLGARIDELPRLSGRNATVYLKLRSDGNIVQPTAVCWDQPIFEIYNTTTKKSVLKLTAYTMSPTTGDGTMYVRTSVGDGDMSNYMATINRKWKDLFVTLTGRDDGKTVVRMWVFGPTFDGVSTSTKTLTGTMEIGPQDEGYVVIGHSKWLYANLGTSGCTRWQSELNSGTASGFKGAIAKFQIFDRVFSNAEMFAYIAGQGGGAAAKVGTQNASADEFAAAGDAGLADPFDASVLPARNFRRRLDASNPSVSVKFPLRAEEERLDKILTVSVRRFDMLELQPVEVLVNGTPAGELAFNADGTRASAYLRKRFMRRDADGYVTVTLRRPAPVAGAIDIDTLDVSGSWAGGVADGKGTDDCFAAANDYYFAQAQFWALRYATVDAREGAPQFVREILGWRKDSCEDGRPIAGKTAYQCDSKVVFNCPAEIAAECSSVFEFGAAASGSNIELDVLLNGTNVKHIGPGVMKGEAFSVVIPPEILVSGANTLVISNSGCRFSASDSTSTYNTFTFDYLRFKVKPPRENRGAMILVR